MEKESTMIIRDEFSKNYADYLNGTYDLVDRIVLNGYYRLAQSAGGFREFWRRLHGSDENLDNTHLIRWAGRFARRVHAFANKNQIPIIECKKQFDDDKRKHEIAAELLPSDPEFTGVFCILYGRAPASIFDIKRFGNGGIDIRRKKPYPYVNHYSFHIIDPDWGHLVIKLCPHLPFNAQIILNAHEYTARQAKKARITFEKIDNCFTSISNAAGFAKIADTMTAPGCGGQLEQVCERWIYSSCLCFVLSLGEQQEVGFHYQYSVYQAEYSRNLRFRSGQVMEELFDSLIDRTRTPLNIKTVKTIFGAKQRPRRGKKGKRRRCEKVVETPDYDLTVFKVHFGKLTAKIYSKGEHILRIEAIAHNVSELRFGRDISKFSLMIAELRAILERFIKVLSAINSSFIDLGLLDDLAGAGNLGKARVAGINLDSRRIRAVMEAVMALAAMPRGFQAHQLATHISAVLGVEYTPRQAAYDLRKLRAKDLVEKIPKSRRYRPTDKGLPAIATLCTLRDKVIRPLLAGTLTTTAVKPQQNEHTIDNHYRLIRDETAKLFQILGIAA
jgi:hypothetical protein